MSGASSRTFGAWGIAVDDYERRFLVGIGYSSHLTGEKTDWSQPVTTLLFKTRAEARAAVARWRSASTWAFTGKRAGAGGNRIYRSAKVVRLKVTVSEVV